MFACALALMSAGSGLEAQSPSAEWSRAFDLADQESRHVLAGLKCLAGLGGPFRAGAFANTDSAAYMITCVETRQGYFGVRLRADSAYTRAITLATVMPETSSRYYGALDTARVLAIARAERLAWLRTDSVFRRQGRTYFTTSYTLPGDSTQVWLLPTSTLLGVTVTVGGERSLVISPDGRTIAREVDAQDAYRAMTIADTGVVLIKSRGESVPTMSELLWANYANELGRVVTIELPRSSATLVGAGASAVWIHRPKAP